MKTMKREDEKILICDNCKTKACAEGFLFCEEYKISGFEEVTEAEYAEISKNNPYLSWDDE